MREIRLYGSEGGGPQFNAASLPLSLPAVGTAAADRLSWSCQGAACKQVSPFAPRKNAAFAERKATLTDLPVLKGVLHSNYRLHGFFWRPASRSITARGTNACETGR